jgi:hypothetical protein
VSHSLNTVGTWTKLDQSPDCHSPYNYNTYGRFLFGIESNDWSCYLICENCIVYTPDITSPTTSIKAYWNDDHSRIQISGNQFYKDEIFLVVTSNICYDCYIAGEVYDYAPFIPPQDKTFHQLWRESYNNYCNTTDDGIYHFIYDDYENEVWVSILNVMEVKNKISLDVNNIHIETTGVIKFNGFKFSSGNNVLQILDSNDNPVMTITKGARIKFNYPNLS